MSIIKNSTGNSESHLKYEPWKTRQPEISFGRSTRPIKKSDRNVCFIFTSIYFECVSVIACIWLPEWEGGYHYVCRDTNM